MPAFIALCGHYTTPAAGRTRIRRASCPDPIPPQISGNPTAVSRRGLLCYLLTGKKKMFRLLLYQNFSYNPTMRSLHADHAALPPVFKIPLLRVCCRSGGLLRDVARLSLDVNRGSLPPVAEIPIRKNTLSRWQACQGYGIISAERLQRGRFSLIAHPAGRPEGASAFCSPQAWYNVSRAL